MQDALFVGGSKVANNSRIGAVSIALILCY
jgi:hypothetical protein